MDGFRSGLGERNVTAGRFPAGFRAAGAETDVGSSGDFMDRSVVRMGFSESAWRTVYGPQEYFLPHGRSEIS